MICCREQRSLFPTEHRTKKIAVEYPNMRHPTASYVKVGQVALDPDLSGPAKRGSSTSREMSDLRIIR